MKNKKLKILILIFVLFMSLFFVKNENSYAIYREDLNTQVSLSIIDPSTVIQVTLHLNDGTNNTMTEYRTYNEVLGNVTPAARTNYNFP